VSRHVADQSIELRTTLMVSEGAKTRSIDNELAPLRTERPRVPFWMVHAKIGHEDALAPGTPPGKSEQLETQLSPSSAPAKCCFLLPLLLKDAN
jgi:hypothetical protein